MSTRPSLTDLANSSPNQVLRITFCLGLLFALAHDGLAVGFRNLNQDAEAIGRGNAFVATADNPSAIYYNPAGISGQGASVQFGMHFIQPTSVYTPTSNAYRTSAETGVQFVPQTYGVIPIKETPLTLGLGLYSPYGLAIEWPEDSGFRTLAIEGNLMYATINPIIAIEPIKKLSFAIGPTFNYADIQIIRGIVAPGDKFEFKGDDIAYGFTAGIKYQPWEKWSFGVSYRNQTTMNFEGNTVVQSVTPNLFPSYTDPAGGEMPFARVVVAGVSFRPTPKWNLEFNLDWSDWNSMKTLILEQQNYGNVDFPLEWRSSFIYELGVSHYFDSGIFVNGGFFYSENSTSDYFFSPMVPDTDLRIGSLGLGYQGKHWSGALSGQITLPSNARIVEDSYSASLIGESADGRYYWENWTINFSVGYRF